MVRFVCRFCHHEFIGKPYTSLRVVGKYAECPYCGSENEVEVEDELSELDDWEEDLEDAFSST